MTQIEFWYHHAGISVIDMDGQIEWYSRMLGFAVERRYYVEKIPAEVAILRNGPLQFELLRVPTPVKADTARSTPDDDLQTTGNKHVAFACDDVCSLVELLRQRGADIVWVREIRPGRHVAFLRDLEGNLIEFVQGPEPDETRAVL
jgi:methylmalonyl-CoA/ethylmalonyl-CoA epimerase